MSTPSLSLNKLLRLAFSGPTNWLCGEAKKDRSVNWVVLSLDDARAEDVLLLAVDQFEENVISRAQTKEVSAVILLGDDPPIELGSSDLPIISVSEEGEVRDVQRTLLTMLINQRALFTERRVHIHAQLSQMSAEGEGLHGLARAMGEISGRGILVQDKRLRTLANHPSSALLAIWEDVQEHLKTVDCLPEALQDRKSAGKRNMVITQPIPGGLARIVTPITVGGVARGYLSLLGIASELDTLDRLVAEQGALVCAVEMSRTKAVREAEKRLKGDLLTALLQENLSPRDARLWAQTMGLDLTQAYVALRFTWDAASSPSRRRLETLINGEISRQRLKVIVNPMGTEVVCFCPVPPNSGRPELALTLGQAILGQGISEHPDTPARCGVGVPASDLSEWRTSFRQAGQALEMSRRLGASEPLFFPDLSVYRLLLQIEHNPELMAFQEEILGSLLAYEGGGDLIRTLEAYFENNGNLSQTAEALYIHRNTLLYRMDRIAEITDLDLDNAETRLAMQLALRIYRMMSG